MSEDDMARLSLFADRCMTFKDRALRGMADAARDVKSELRQIKAGNYSLFPSMRPLTPGYLERKRTMQVLKEQGKYLGSIKVVSGRMSFAIRTSMGLLAKYLEFGTKNMKPIPHWKYIRVYAISRVRFRMLEAVKDLVR